MSVNNKYKKLSKLEGSVINLTYKCGDSAHAYDTITGILNLETKNKDYIILEVTDGGKQGRKLEIEVNAIEYFELA